MMKKITFLVALFVSALCFSQELPFDFSSPEHAMTGGDGAVVSVVKEDGTTNDVVQIVGAMHAWDHAAVEFSRPLDLSDDNNNTITFRIQPLNLTGRGEHLLKLENSPSDFAELPFQTVGGGWQTISLDFGPSLKSYNKMVIMLDYTAENADVSDTYLIDDIAGAKHSDPPVLPNLPFDFSDANHLMNQDGGAQVSIIKDGDNDVMQIIGSTAPWDNAQVIFQDPLDLSDDSSNTITFRMKPVNGTGNDAHAVKFEGGTGGPAIAEIPFSTSGTDWQDISVDFGSGLGSFTKMVIFTDFGEANAGVSDTYLIDDIALAAGDGGGGNTNFCETPVTHMMIPAETASAIKLTIENTGTTTMKVTVESSDADPVDELVIPAVTGAPTISAKDESVAGKISVTLTWGTAPTDPIDLNILWSKVSMAGNWQLSASTVAVDFNATCGTASVANNQLLGLSIYPNPANSQLNISAADAIQNADVYNLLGKKVMSVDVNNTRASLDVSSLSSGMYLIKYSSNGKIGTAKFIKE